MAYPLRVLPQVSSWCGDFVGGPARADYGVSYSDVRRIAAMRNRGGELRRADF